LYLSTLKIRNFRQLTDAEVYFSPNVNIIVGENNSGKTTIVDALRMLLIHHNENLPLYVTEDDFTEGADPKRPIELSCIFSDLSVDEEALLYDCLVKKDESFEAHLYCRYELTPKGGHPVRKLWGGETEGGSWPNNLWNQLSCIYLPPLRDPLLKQTSNLTFVDPKVDTLIAQLKAIVDNLDIEQNGLGYNNLLYIATTVGTLQRDKELAFRGMLIEEPEAHLHPQLQTLLLRYLNQVSEGDEENDEAPVQVILSTHSPTFASQASIDSIISLYEKEGQ